MSGVALRNITQNITGTSMPSLHRHKESCAADLMDSVREQRRAGLLGKLDGIHDRIIELEQQFPEQSQTQVQLISRRLEALDKEAKLLGEYTKDRENPATSDDIAAKLTANLQALGWSDAKIAELTKRPIASLVGAQELGEAD